MSVTVPTLSHGESARLEMVIQVLEDNQCLKWWHFWHPLRFRDATEEEIRELAKGLKS